MAMITLKVEQKEKFNKYFPEQYQRNVAMSIFASIKYWQDKEVGFLRFSLDKLYKRYKNKFFLTLSNFKKIANKLVSLGLLKTMNKGRLKFYGTDDCKSDDEVREENKKLREENNKLSEELERVKRELEEFKREVREKLHNSSKKEIIQENGECEKFENEVVSQDVVIETAYEMMEEAGIKKGSTVFFQVIESLYEKTDKEPLHKKGYRDYIKKVIHNKIHNQSKFKELLRNVRRKPSIFMTKAEEQRYINLERKLLGWEI
ncbi:MAG: hypothetical protein E7C50_00525 [Clostridium sp.]|uniref:hypothetical protein n=1 Tax=Clostridium sp. TaxID=1506 RepID=UPI00290511A5|nr:hypothetical protein [Clostridium sp.]MDU2673072.1 hypothetical protein [Clostridium sp.]MDU2680344.1 hypothetical protein [Clostridium sp.]